MEKIKKILLGLLLISLIIGILQLLVTENIVVLLPPFFILFIYLFLDRLVNGHFASTFVGHDFNVKLMNYFFKEKVTKFNFYDYLERFVYASMVSIAVFLITFFAIFSKFIPFDSDGILSNFDIIFPGIFILFPLIYLGLTYFICRNYKKIL